jgi:dihydropteroate synthase
MPLPEIYLKPLGLFKGPAIDGLVKNGRAGRLAGGRTGFTHIELVSRKHGSAGVKAYEEISASRQSILTEALAKIEAPRAAVSGFDFSKPVIMGIINATPDSFSDGGQFDSAEAAIQHGRKLVADGAEILDIGGESTRPGSEPVSEQAELNRILPIFNALAGSDVVLSCDTRKSSVMRAATRAGATMINDVTALTYQPDARETVASLGVPVVLMHSRGEPKTMQDNPEYDDVCLDIYDALLEKIASCEAAGIPREQIIADPGIGFGKTFEHNLQLLHGLAMFHGLGVPLLLGVSRKAFIGALTGEKEAAQRVAGSVAAALAGLQRGVQLFRVHDVRETAQAFAVWSGVERQMV